ncbi:unnamed protein product [Parajaminaea phylloscopi]
MKLQAACSLALLLASAASSSGVHDTRRPAISEHRASQNADRIRHLIHGASAARLTHTTSASSDATDDTSAIGDAASTLRGASGTRGSRQGTSRRHRKLHAGMALWNGTRSHRKLISTPSSSLKSSESDASETTATSSTSSESNSSATTATSSTSSESDTSATTATHPSSSSSSPSSSSSKDTTSHSDESEDTASHAHLSADKTRTSSDTSATNADSASSSGSDTDATADGVLPSPTSSHKDDSGGLLGGLGGLVGGAGSLVGGQISTLGANLGGVATVIGGAPHTVSTDAPSPSSRTESADTASVTSIFRSTDSRIGDSTESATSTRRNDSSGPLGAIAGNLGGVVGGAGSAVGGLVSSVGGGLGDTVSSVAGGVGNALDPTSDQTSDAGPTPSRTSTKGPSKTADPADNDGEGGKGGGGVVGVLTSLLGGSHESTTAAPTDSGSSSRSGKPASSTDGNGGIWTDLTSIIGGGQNTSPTLSHAPSSTLDDHSTTQMDAPTGGSASTVTGQPSATLGVPSANLTSPSFSDGLAVTSATGTSTEVSSAEPSSSAYTDSSSSTSSSTSAAITSSSTSQAPYWYAQTNSLMIPGSETTSSTSTQTTSTAPTPEATTASEGVISWPSAILPSADAPVQPVDTVPVSVLLKPSMKWTWMIQNPDTTAQVLAFMPSLFSNAVGNGSVQDTTLVRLQSYSGSDTPPSRRSARRSLQDWLPRSAGTAGTTTDADARTLYVAYYSSEWVDQLQAAISNTSSAFYSSNLSNPAARELAANVDASWNITTTVLSATSKNGASLGKRIKRSTTATVRNILVSIAGAAVACLAAFLAYRFWRSKKQAQMNLQRASLRDPTIRSFGNTSLSDHWSLHRDEQQSTSYGPRPDEGWHAAGQPEMSEIRRFSAQQPALYRDDSRSTQGSGDGPFADPRHGALNRASRQTERGLNAYSHHSMTSANTSLTEAEQVRQAYLARTRPLSAGSMLGGNRASTQPTVPSPTSSGFESSGSLSSTRSPVLRATLLERGGSLKTESSARQGSASSLQHGPRAMRYHGSTRKFGRRPASLSSRNSRISNPEMQANSLLL